MAHIVKGFQQLRLGRGPGRCLAAGRGQAFRAWSRGTGGADQL